MLFTCKLFGCLNMREFTDVWKFENDGAGGKEACHTLFGLERAP